VVYGVESGVRSSRQTDREKADTWPPSVASNKSLYTFVTAVSVLWKRRYADCIGGIRSLLPRNSWSRHWTNLSNNLERNDKFDTGLKFFISLASRPLFFNSGRITACLNSEGKQPETSDVLHSKTRKGDNTLRTSFTSHVGTGWSWQVFVGAEPISFYEIGLMV